MTTVAVVRDLMDRTRIRAAVPDVSFDVAGAATADRVLVDLTHPRAFEVIAAAGGHTVGFGPHVDDDLLARARAAGCDEVLARSVFFRRLTD